jgi:hypothetical protein
MQLTAADAAVVAAALHAAAGEVKTAEQQARDGQR